MTNQKNSLRHNRNPRKGQTPPPGRRPTPAPAGGQPKPPSKPPSTEPKMAQRKWTNNRRAMTFVTFIFIVFVLVYSLQGIYASLKSTRITTEVIRLSSIESPRTIKGIIIRDEHLYYAERDGQIEFAVNDYDRVKPGTVICNIQNKDAVKDNNQNMASIEEQIMELQLLRQDISAVDPAVQRINGQLKHLVDGRIHHFTSQSIHEVYNLKDSLSQMINTRNQMILDDNKYVKEELGLELQNLNERRSMFTTPIRAAESGIMSPIMDGYEEVYTLENRKELTREQILFKIDYDKIIPARDVKPGDPVFKIVASNVWYIAAFFPKDLIEGFKEGQVRTLYVELDGEYIPLPMTIERLDEHYQDSYILLKGTKNIIDFLNTRNINIKTTGHVRTGLKISNSAIISRDFFSVPHEYLFGSDKEKHVIKYVDEIPVIVPVNVVVSDERYAYIPIETDNLGPDDEIISTEYPDDRFTLYEICTMQGVYKTNNGFAEFKKITSDELPDTGAFIILNPALNPGLKVYDQIVTNGADVKDGQIVY